MKVFDVFLFGFELDLLEIRMNILDPYVDHFVFCEGVKTLSGMDKEMYFEKNADRYSKFKDKIIFTQIDEPSSKVLQEYGRMNAHKMNPIPTFTL